MVADRIGNTLQQAKQISLGITPKGFQELIGGGDRTDIYGFSLRHRSRLNLVLIGLQADANLQLLNPKGQIVSQSRKAGKSPERIDAVLPKGTYYVQVLAAGRRSPITAYTLKASASRASMGDAAGNNLGQSLDLGMLSGNRTLNDWVGYTDTADYYRFTLSDRNQLKINLTGQSEFLDLELLDRDGFFLDYLRSLSGRGELNKSLAAGTYFLRVTLTGPDTPYTLKLMLPTVDLQPALLDVADGLTVGSSFTTNFQVQNRSSENAGAFQVGFYLSSDPHISGGDRLIGTSTIRSLAANSVTFPQTATLTLPPADDLFWQANGTYYVGMMVDSLSAIPEADEQNNANRGFGIDRDSVTISGISTTRPFNIEFDYSQDRIGWFTPERRNTLEAAANIWEKMIQNDCFGVTDLTLTVSARDLGGSTLGIAINGESFDPTGCLEFDVDTPWFFDASPNTADDLPANQIDFLTVALHEMGHSLGFSNGDERFRRLTENGGFIGVNAQQHNGGKPIPLDLFGAHIEPGYEWGGSGQMLMDPFMPMGKRLLPTVLDLAVLDDLGFTVNYPLATQNLPGNAAVVRAV